MLKMLGNSLAILMLTAIGQAAWADSDIDDLQKEVSELKQGQESMRKDLEEIKKLLKENPRAARNNSAFKPQEVTLNKKVPFKGDRDAPITILEFSDYQCPFCRRHANDTLPTLTEKYISTGKLKYVMRENPLENIHPRAMRASQAALCANDEGKYWEMHDQIFANQRKMTDEDFLAHGESIGLNGNKFSKCMESSKYEEQVKQDLAEGKKLGIRGTPGFLLGFTDAKNPDKVRLTKFLNGARTPQQFSNEIDRLLKELE